MVCIFFSNFIFFIDNSGIVIDCYAMVRKEVDKIVIFISGIEILDFAEA